MSCLAPKMEEFKEEAIIPIQVVFSDFDSLLIRPSFLQKLIENSNKLKSQFENQLSDQKTDALMLEFCDTMEFCAFMDFFGDTRLMEFDQLEMFLNLAEKFESKPLMIACAISAMKSMKISVDICNLPLYVEIMNVLKVHNMCKLYNSFVQKMFSILCDWVSTDWNNMQAAYFANRFRPEFFYRLKFLVLEYRVKIQCRFRHDYQQMQYVCKINPCCESFGLLCMKCRDFVCRCCGSVKNACMSGSSASSPSSAEDDAIVDEDPECCNCRELPSQCPCIKWGSYVCPICSLCSKNPFNCKCQVPNLEDDFWATLVTEITKMN